MKKTKKIGLVILNILTVSLICLLLSNKVNAEWTGGSGTGGNYNGGCNGKAQNCARPFYEGSFWIKLSIKQIEEKDAKGKTKLRPPTATEVLGDYGKKPSFDLDKKYVNGKYFQTVFKGCKKQIYILVTPLSKYGIAGPYSVDDVINEKNRGGKGFLSVKAAKSRVKKSGLDLPGDAEILEETKVRKKFEIYKKKVDYDREYIGGDLGWFCADHEKDDPEYTTPTPDPPTPDPPSTAIECSARATREWGDTRTRIAVRNASLDGKSWTAKDERQGLPTDSGWTDSGGTYWTIAKPGDGVQFYHEFCAGDRFVRRTPTPSYEGYHHESHDQVFTITPNKFKIGATPESYAFGNGIEWTNKIGESIDRYSDLFNASGKPDGVSLTYNGYGVAVPSPTPNNKDYDCPNYKSDNPYRKGTYQIPGFDYGECNSSKKTGISNPVGSTITQWHDFNRVKAWERYSYDGEGYCGCGVGDARFGRNYDYDEYIDWGEEHPKNSRGEEVSKGNTWGYRSDWRCGSVSRNSCDCYCAKTDIYGNCLSVKCRKDLWHFTRDSAPIKYESMQRDYGTVRKTAHAYVPYNYSTSISSRILNDDHLLQGTGVNSRFIWKIEPRENDKLSDFDYATVTPKNTQVQMVEFLYHPDNQSVEGKEFSRENPEAFFKSKGAIMTNAQTIASGNQNPRGLYDGKRSSKTITSVVPDNDEWVGYKYCVAVGIFPADSHDDINGENNSLEMQYTYGAGAMDAGSYWNISGATCRTIAKKPSFEVWNGSVYTNNGINTSMSHKIVNAKLGSDINAPKDLFGSWTDYAVIAGKKVDGMSSGAMLGFNNGRYNLSGNKGQSANTINPEHLSPETIANKNGETGNSNINANTSINMNLERLRSRYSEKARNMAFNETHTNSQPTIVSSKTGMQFAYFDGNLKTSDLGIRNVANGINQTTSRNRNKDLVKGLGDGKNDNTLVIYVRGNLVIDNNICLGEGCLGNGMQLVDYRFNRKTNSAAKLPQVLIFADNINIAENVTRVDAWLVANNTLNTCAGYDPNSVVAKDALNRYSEGVCYKTLMVNGPVYASELILPRTAGATHGYSPTDSSNVLYRRYGATGESSDSILGSGTPAEIFNLRADAYLWAYNQAQRYSEAIVTYKRELAPRY